MAQTHTDLVSAVMLAVTRAVPGAVVFRVETGSTLHRCHNCGSPAPVRKYGIVGSADVRGYLPGGHGFEVECKVGRDRLRRDQENWRSMCTRLGVVWVLARAQGPEDIMTAAKDAANEVRRLCQSSQRGSGSGTSRPTAPA